MNRREFLTSTGSGIATLLLTPLLAPLVGACGSDDDDDGASTDVDTTTPPPGCTGAGETSTVTNGHTHTLCVPESDLTSPPVSGATYRTSIDDGHDHEVVLSQAQLAIVAVGDAVTITTTTDAGHTHDFTVQRAPVQSPIPTPPTMPYDLVGR